MSDDWERFADIERPGGRWKTWVTIAAVAGAIGLLAVVMLVAVYAFNVGTIWASAEAARTAPPPPSRPAATGPAAVRAIGVRNDSPLDRALLLRHRDGTETLLGRVLAGKSTRIPIEGTCVDGLIVARAGSGEFAESPEGLCAGETWAIGSR